MTSPKRLFLIDGMAQIYRAHFAMIKNPLLTKDGRHTSAIFGFMNSLFKLLREENPDYIAVLLDCPEPTFRHKLYTEYNKGIIILYPKTGQCNNVKTFMVLPFTKRVYS